MKRKEKSQKTREGITDISRRLFISQGYATTTIRQILRETGLTTGTLYHFFRDKEDILKQIATDYLLDVDAIISSLSKDDPDPVVHYAFIISLQLMVAEKNANIAELYLQSYQSWGVSDIICQNSAVRNRSLFGKYNRSISDEDWYLRSLAINGIIQKCLAEKVNRGGIPLKERIHLVLTVAFTLFNVPRAKIDPAIEKTYRTLKNKKVQIYGVSITM